MSDKVGYIGRQTLQQYAATHREQTPDVTGHIKSCADGVLKHVRDVMAGQSDASPREAFQLMDDLRAGLLEVWNAPKGELASNQQAAKSWADQTNAARQGELNGKKVELATARREDGEGLLQPTGTNKTYVDLTQTQPVHRMFKPSTAAVSSRVVSSTVQYGAEEAHVGYMSTGEIESDKSGRRGLANLWQQLDAATPFIQAALSSRTMQLEQTGQYHEVDSSNFSSSSASDVDAQRKMFGRGRVEADSASSVQAGSSKVVNASFEPVGVDALQQIQTLRNLVQNMRSIPASQVTVTAQRGVTEQAQVETTTTQPREFMHAQPAPQVQVSSKDASFDRIWDTTQTTSRDLGTMPYMPAYIDIK